MSLEMSDFFGLRGAELLDRLQRGHPIAVDAIAGRLYHGVSLGLPRWVEALSWKKFAKAFHRAPGEAHVRGWNVRVRQSPLNDPEYAPKRRGHEPATFGHFIVRDAQHGARCVTAADRGLLLDYGAGGNHWLDPTSSMRDPLVALERDSVRLLLGRSYVQLAGRCVGTPSYFVLERGPELDHVALPRRLRRTLGPGVP